MSQTKYETFAFSVTTPGTRVQLSGITSQKHWIIKAHPDNVGNIFIGGSNVTAANGYILEPGEPITHGDFEKDGFDESLDLSKLYIDAVNAADSVRILVFREDR